MNLKLVAALSLFGIAVGSASVLGWVVSIERLLWLAFVVVAALVIGRKAGGRYFLHGFLTGLLAMLIAIVIQAAFFATYLKHNPNAAASFAQLPPSMSPRLVVLVLAPFAGAFCGLVVGAFAAIAGKFMGARRPSAAPTA